MQPKSSSAVVELLSPLWQRILRRTRAELDDNFFELGGDPGRAIELFGEIEGATGRKLPPMLIYQAPTLAELAALLESAETPRLAPIVELRAGTRKPPIFALHGMGGNVMELCEFVSRLETEHAVYGMQSRGTDGTEEPCESVEEFAEYHLQMIGRMEPRGPSILIGYSFGGLVAFEMARRMAERKSEIALLVLIDAYPHRRYVSRGQRTKIELREFRDRVRRAVSGFSGVRESARRPELGLPYTQAMRRIQESTNRALERYQPGHYNGTIWFVRAGVSLHFPDDPGKVWKKLVETIEVETVPGDHHEILSTYADRLAAAISRYLAEPKSENQKKGVRP